MSEGVGLETHSIEVSPPHDGDPDALRRAAHQLQRCAADVDVVVSSVRRTAAELVSDKQWQGAAAEAFLERAVEPVCQTLTSVDEALQRAAIALQRGATSLEEAQLERRKAEGMAIAGGVAVALTVFTFGISDVAAAEAAAGAAALIARAAAAAATATRAVMLAMEDAAAAIRALSVTMRAWGTQLGYAASLTLPRLALSPVGAGAIGAAGTAAMGDTEPSDLIQAFATSYLEDAAGRGSREAGANADEEVAAANAERLERLGRDPATGGYRLSEMETANRIEHQRGVRLERSSDPNVDWIDNSGKSYDAVGNFDGRFFDQQWPNLRERIVDHLRKADYVPIDVSRFSAVQVQLIEQFIADLGPRVFLVCK